MSRTSYLIRLLTIFLFLISSEYVQCASPVSFLLKTPSDSNLSNPYFETYHNRLQIFGYGIHKYSHFQVANPNENHANLKFKPNGTIDFGLGVNYEWLRLAFAVDLIPINANESLYGATKKIDLQVDLLTKKWMYGINTAYYKGYYFENPENLYDKNTIIDSVIKRPDLQTLHAGLQANYVFNNERFSLKAAVINNERQKHSAGSMLLGWYASVYSLQGDSAILYRPVSAQFTSPLEVTSIQSVSIGVSAGYAYTLVFLKNFYATAGGMFGLSVQFVDINGNQPEYKETHRELSPKINLFFGVGYHNDKNFAGLSFWYDSYDVNAANALDFTYSYGKVKFFYGRRFNIARK